MGKMLRLAGWTGVAAIVVLSLVPGPERPHTGMPGQLEHVLAYGLAAGALGLGYRCTGKRIGLLAMLVCSAAVLETTQLWVPGRLAQFIDFAASSIGAALGLLGAAGIDQLLAPGPSRHDM